MKKILRLLKMCFDNMINAHSNTAA